MSQQKRRQKRRRPRVPAYVRRIQAIHALGGLGPGVHQFEVLHDDDCAIFRGGDCACRFELRLRRSTPASMN